MKKHIPNFITCSNLACGCIGLVFAFNGELVHAVYFMWGAMILDFFDGFAARLLKVSSDIGKQLDSLADMVSFGVLPAVLMFQMIGESNLVAFSAFLIAVFSALRLAKFNIDENQESEFIGLPTPANALFISGLVFIQLNPDLVFLLNQYTLVLIAMLFSLLLVAPIKLFSLKLKSLKWQENKVRVIFIAMSLIIFFWLQVVGLPLVIVLYMVLSLVKNGFKI